MPPLQLGFLDAATRLPSHEPRSKVGGLPIWIREPISREAAQCTACHRSMTLLVQLDTPLDDMDRMVYVFFCSNLDDRRECQKNFLVLRTVLPISSSANDSEASKTTVTMHHDWNACSVCGFLASNRCSTCKLARYCSQTCQSWDWKTGGHQATCAHQSALTESESMRRLSKLYAEKCLPDYDIVMDEEAEQVEPAEPHQALMTLPTMEADQHEAEDYDSGNPSSPYAADAIFLKFEKAIRHYPSQILRYLRVADDKGQVHHFNPIWICQEGMIESHETVPVCPHCQSPRTAEFQILPQLISLLRLKESHPCFSMDWSNIVVYTCTSDACSPSGASPYYIEHAQVQFMSLTRATS